MATLIKTRGTTGEQCRCDARCYDAKGPNCDCCCGGKNHGVGLDQAIKNMQDQADEILETYIEAHEGTEVYAQLMLF